MGGGDDDYDGLGYESKPHSVMCIRLCTVQDRLRIFTSSAIVYLGLRKLDLSKAATVAVAVSYVGAAFEEQQI